MTYTPNRFHHEDQRIVYIEPLPHVPLVHLHCSPVVKFFLCSLYAPVCDKVYGKELLPCRSVCEQAKAGWLPIMKKFGYDWPKELECDLFPEKKDNPFCTASENYATIDRSLWKSTTTGGPRIGKPRPTKTNVGHKFT